jgi:hypothetical protein
MLWFAKFYQVVEVEVDSVRGCRFATQVEEFEDASDAGGHRHVVLCDRGDQPIHVIVAVAYCGIFCCYWVLACVAVQQRTRRRFRSSGMNGL